MVHRSLKNSKEGNKRESKMKDIDSRRLQSTPRTYPTPLLLRLSHTCTMRMLRHQC